MKQIIRKLRGAGITLFYVFCKGFIPLIVKVFYGDVWKLKTSLQRRPGALRSRIYYGYLARGGNWIGIGSHLAETPTFPHGLFGIFISDKAIIGRGAVIFHQVTIGSNTLSGSKMPGSPHIGDNVYMGAGAKIIGCVHVGDNVRIGANAVVVKDVPQNATAVAAQTVIRVREQPNDNRYTPIQDAEI